MQHDLDPRDMEAVIRRLGQEVFWRAVFEDRARRASTEGMRLDGRLAPTAETTSTPITPEVTGMARQDNGSDEGAG